MSFQYPADLAEFVRNAWCHVCADPAEGLPPAEALEHLFSTCFQASLLREETRPVTFRVVVVDPELLPESEGPPDGFHRIRFEHPFELNPQILRRLSPAVEFSHSLLGVQYRDSTHFEVWGIVHSGTGWISNLYGGRRPFRPLPSALVISVTGSGSMSVSNGSRVVGKLTAGQLSAPSPDVFSAHWLLTMFVRVRQEISELMLEQSPGIHVPHIDPNIGRSITQGVLRRAMQMVRDRGHGGTLLIAPPEMAAELEAPDNPYLTIGYGFVNEEPRRRFRSLLRRLLLLLSEHFKDKELVGLADYIQCQHPPLREVDVAIEEWSYLLASLASVDGAVLVTQRFELLGFGVEISGHLPSVKTLHRAVDIEARELRLEDAERYGTRHRSAYRLCAQLPDLLAIVLSQDGHIQMVKYLNDKLTCWDQLSVGAQDI